MCSNKTLTFKKVSNSNYQLYFRRMRCAKFANSMLRGIFAGLTRVQLAKEVPAVHRS